MSVDYEKVAALFNKRAQFCELFPENDYSVCFLSAAYAYVFNISITFNKTRNRGKRTDRIGESRKICVKLSV